MNTNLIMKNSFMEKMKRFLKKFFNKKNDDNLQQTNILIENEIKVKCNTPNSFDDRIRVKIKNDYLTNLKRQTFLKELENNPSLFYELPIEKLEKIDKYYDELIAKYQAKLSKLKKDA